MLTKYQVLILEERGASWGSDLKSALVQHLEEIGLSEESYCILSAYDFHKYDPAGPLVCVYFASGQPDSKFATVLDRVLSDSRIIIPVVRNLIDFRTHAPDILHEFNGFPIEGEGGGVEALAGRVLESLKLLREERRIFISYRRADSSKAALQLYEFFDARGFDVFLDTNGVRPGEKFQEILWHRLNDTDVVIFLDTPTFLESQWTVQEIARASALCIGVLQVVWPAHEKSRESGLFVPFLLENDHFNPSYDPTITAENTLSEKTLRSIWISVESLRARSLAARHANLVTNFCNQLKRIGASVRVEQDRTILVRVGAQQTHTVVPIIGVPSAVQYDAASSRYASPGSASLLYDHLGILEKWCAHLDWLDQHLPVKSLRVIDAQVWFNKLPGTSP